LGWDLRKRPAIQLWADWRSGAMPDKIPAWRNCQVLGGEEGVQVDAE